MHVIRLRDVQPEDKDLLRGWRNLPEVARYMYTDHFITPEEHEQWFVRAMQDPARRYWIIQCDGEDVGLVNLYDIDFKNRRCSWAFYVASPNVRGKGVGSFVEYTVLEYVFETLKLNKLCCEVLAFNDAVVKMHKRFGFEQEGYFRQHVFKKDGPHDVVCLGMLRSEWEARKEEITARLRAKGLI